MTKRIILGVTGGIAAYKSADLLRKMVRAGWAVQVVMTQAATQFVGPVTFEALSGQPVYSEIFDSGIENAIPHITLSQGIDAIVIAPATADTLARLVQGRADDLLASLCLARRCPLIVAPAMNTHMWRHPATQRNVDQLRADGVIVLGPDQGELACGESGEGRMLEVDALWEGIQNVLAPKFLSGKRCLVTAGPTSEPIDPVRLLTNASSGKMGYAIARAAQAAGAEVTLISGPTALPFPYGVRVISVQRAQEMYEAVMNHVPGVDVFISVAAVSDYRVENYQNQKIKKKSGESLTLRLTPNPDILASVAALPDSPYCVGFAAETEDWIANGEAKRQQKGIPLIVVNSAAEALGSDRNELTLLEAGHTIPWPADTKQALAERLIGHIAQKLSSSKEI